MSTDWGAPTLSGRQRHVARVGRSRHRLEAGLPQRDLAAHTAERASSRWVGPWPALDGLRAVAVAAVFAYHLNPRWLPGGFLGVDVFFVLSGFLITSLLLDEWRRVRTIRVGAFYRRRARRLLPGLYLMVITVILVTGVVARFELSRLRGDVIAALAYATNWTQILWNQSYFAALRPPSFLEHLWSLAIEEQFYLVWPLILLVCLKANRRNLALTIALAAVAASTILMAVLYSPVHDPSRVYYGSDTHGAPILLGAAVAIARSNWLRSRAQVQRRHRAEPRSGGSVNLLALGGAAVVGYFMARVGYLDSGLYRGGFLVVAVATALLVLAAVQTGSVAARLLGSRWLRWIGVRSYGIYLWHWPIIQLTRPDLHPWFSGATLNVARVGLTLLAATISYRLVEAPIRQHGLSIFLRRADRVDSPNRGAVGRPPAGRRSTAPPRGRGVVWPPWLVVAFGSAVVVAVTSLSLAHLTSAAAGPTGLVGARQTITVGAPAPGAGSIAHVVAPPTVTSATTSAGPPPFTRPVRTSFFGDSQGMTLIDAAPSGLSEYLRLHDDTLEGCGILGGVLTASSGLSRDLDVECGGWQRKWTASVNHDRPQIAVIEIGAWEVFNIKVDGRKLAFGTPAWDQYFDQQLAQGISILKKSGAQVALLSVPCYQPTTDGWAERGDRSRTSHLNTLLDDAANADPRRVFMIQSAAQFCSDPEVEGNTDYRWDGTHFAGKGAAIEFQAIAGQLMAIPAAA